MTVLGKGDPLHNQSIYAFSNSSSLPSEQSKSKQIVFIFVLGDTLSIKPSFPASPASSR